MSQIYNVQVLPKNLEWLTTPMLSSRTEERLCTLIYLSIRLRLVEMAMILWHTRYI